MKSNVTLRGAGANQTRIVSTDAGACTASYGASLVIAGTSLYPPSASNTATWTAGYAKGTTQITLGSTANLQVGMILLLDQNDDVNSPIPDGIWMCKNAGVCSTDGAIAFLRTNRNNVQAVRASAINGNTVTLEQPLFMPNWRAERSPGAYWSSGQPITGAGVEDLTLDTGANGDQHGIVTENAYGNWVLRTRIIDGNPSSPKRCLLCSFAGSVRNTTRSNYFYGSRGAVAAIGTYGYEMRGASANLHENNIWEDNTIPFVQGQGAQGNVFAYNYTYSNWYVAGSGSWPSGCGVTLNCIWMQASARYHAIGNNYTLFEGNDGNGFTADALRGASVFGTSFRNYWVGWDPEGGASDANGKQQQTVAVQLYSWNRFFNFVGNVLGRAGSHTVYECAAATTNDGCPSFANQIWVLGMSGNQQWNGQINNDTRVKETLLRWGNYDNVTGAARWDSSEVPSGDAYFPNAVPQSQVLPASLYLPAKPNWYGSIQWPSIGPDVSGSIGPGSKVIKIPARVCYESMTDDPAYSGGNAVRVFNGSSCYGGTPTSPSTPTISAPTISNISVSIRQGVATITWNTDVPSTARVEYGTSASLGSNTDTSASLSTTHTRTLTLSPGTYNFRVVSGADGREGTSANQSFTVRGKPPTITLVSAGEGSVILNWSNPSFDGFAGTAILRSRTNHYTTYRPEAEVVRTHETTYRDHDVLPNTTYYYTLFVYDDQGNYSDPVSIVFATTDKTEGPGDSNEAVEERAGTSLVSRMLEFFRKLLDRSAVSEAQE